MSGLVFADPPESVRATKWTGRLTEIAKHPNRWVNVTESFGLGPNNLPHYCVRIAARRLGYEVEIRSVSRGKSDAAVYVRVIGDVPLVNGKKVAEATFRADGLVSLASGRTEVAS